MKSVTRYSSFAVSLLLVSASLLARIGDESGVEIKTVDSVPVQANQLKPQDKVWFLQPKRNMVEGCVAGSGLAVAASLITKQRIEPPVAISGAVFGVIGGLVRSRYQAWKHNKTIDVNRVEASVSEPDPPVLEEPSDINSDGSDQDTEFEKETVAPDIKRKKTRERVRDWLDGFGDGRYR